VQHTTRAADSPLPLTRLHCSPCLRWMTPARNVASTTAFVVQRLPPCDWALESLGLRRTCSTPFQRRACAIPCCGRNPTGEAPQYQLLRGRTEGCELSLIILWLVAHTRHPCHWDGKDIVVLEEVHIQPPYTPDKCTGGSAAACERVRLVLQNERSRLGLTAAA
jgi:hypothetical protein